MKFSVDKDSILFGLGNSTSEYHLKLAAANTFGRIRKDLDKNKTLLETFTLRQFRQRKNKDHFQKNVTSLVNGDIQKFPPLLQTDTRDDSLSPECLFNKLILAFFSLTETNVAGIKKHGLMKIFPALFFRVVGDCYIYNELRNEFVKIIEDVCNKSQTETAKALSDLLQPEQTEESRPSKRQRLNPPEASETLIFRPEDLSPPKTDVQPDLIPKNVVFQFIEARGDRLPGVFGSGAILKAMTAGSQWCWERQQEASSPDAGEMRTNAIIAMVSNNKTQDVSFVLRVGYNAGRRIINYLAYRDTIELSN